jgi:hypothetical protein
MTACAGKIWSSNEKLWGQGVRRQVPKYWIFNETGGFVGLPNKNVGRVDGLKRGNRPYIVVL